MAVMASSPPEGARAVVAAALGQQLGRRQLAALKGPLGLSNAIPRFAVATKGRASLRRAHLVSWDFLAVGSEDVALASLIITHDEPVLASVNYGVFAARVLDAARIGAERLEPTKMRYSPLLLDARQAGIFSLVFAPERGPAWTIDIVDGTLLPPEALTMRNGVRQLVDRIHMLSRPTAGDTDQWILADSE
jgi:hypothetical protein